MGQCNVWYAHETHLKEVAQCRKRVWKRATKGGALIAAAVTKKQGGGAPHQVDVVTKQAVEEAAVSLVTERYCRQGFDVTSVEAENCGWDLEADKDGETVLLEVKGLSGAFGTVELTPNEFRQMKRNWRTYRVCVVSSALSGKPSVRVFECRAKGGPWIDQHGKHVTIQQFIGARLSA